jgi:cytochrome P450
VRRRRTYSIPCIIFGDLHMAGRQINIMFILYRYNFPCLCLFFRSGAGKELNLNTQVSYDLYSQDFARHAYEIFTQIRRNTPIFQQPGLDGRTPIWFVSRFADVEAVLKDDRHFTLDYRKVFDADEIPEMRGSQTMQMVNNHLLTKDGEDHRRLRSLVTQAFTPRRISSMRPRIQAIADGLLDQVEINGQMDLVDSYAFPLPITVIAELLGIPAEDRNTFRGWSDIFVRPALTEEAQAQFMQMAMAFVAYLSNLFRERQKEPKDDLISALIHAEEAGDRLSTEELFSMVILLIVAGHETTVSLIGNAAVAVLTHPETMQRLKEHPEQMPQAVEEFLRYDPPVNRAITRIVAEDLTLGEHSFHRGDLVIVLLGSANRDETQFSHPDLLDIERDAHSHIAFGRGVHYCLGAPLAKLEGEIALNTLLQRLPGLRLSVDVEQMEFRTVPLFRAYTHIPVEWG